MDTKQMVVAQQDSVNGGLELHLKAERVQEPTALTEGSSVSYTYELATNQLQPMTVELPLFTVKFHGLPAWGLPGGATEAVPADAGRLG